MEISEQDILKPIKPTIALDDNEWEIFDLYSATVADPVTHELVDLFSANESRSVVVTGRLRIGKEQARYLKKPWSDNREKIEQLTLKIKACHRWAYGQTLNSDGVAIWAAGKAGWYQISPSSAYSSTYKHMEQASKLIYFLIDIHTSRFKRKGQHLIVRPGLDAIFSEYAFTELGRGHASKAKQIFASHKDFLLARMDEDSESVPWKSTEIYEWLMQADARSGKRKRDNKRELEDSAGREAKRASVEPTEHLSRQLRVVSSSSDSGVGSFRLRSGRHGTEKDSISDDNSTSMTSLRTRENTTTNRSHEKQESGSETDAMQVDRVEISTSENLSSGSESGGSGTETNALISAYNPAPGIVSGNRSKSWAIARLIREANKAHRFDNARVSPLNILAGLTYVYFEFANVRAAKRFIEINAGNILSEFSSRELAHFEDHEVIVNLRNASQTIEARDGEVRPGSGQPTYPLRIREQFLPKPVKSKPDSYGRSTPGNIRSSDDSSEDNAPRGKTPRKGWRQGKSILRPSLNTGSFLIRRTSESDSENVHIADTMTDSDQIAAQETSSTGRRLRTRGSRVDYRIRPLDSLPLDEDRPVNIPGNDAEEVARRMDLETAEPAKDVSHNPLLKLISSTAPSLLANQPGDVWECTYDGCTQKIYAASEPSGQSLIREHVNQQHLRHAFDSSNENDEEEQEGAKTQRLVGLVHREVQGWMQHHASQRPEQQGHLEAHANQVEVLADGKVQISGEQQQQQNAPSTQFLLKRIREMADKAQDGQQHHLEEGQGPFSLPLPIRRSAY